jgi:hypothetical protein
MIRRTVCVVAFVLIGAWATIGQPVSIDPTPPIPPVIDAGFALWVKNGLPAALDLWQKGGLLEGDHKIVALGKYLKRIEPLVGGYRSYELIDARKISPNSQLVYLAINFERGAVYARFLLYRAADIWVVQNMDFNIKPELIVPWLAFAGSNGTE